MTHLDRLHLIKDVAEKRRALQCLIKRKHTLTPGVRIVVIKKVFTAQQRMDLKEKERIARDARNAYYRNRHRLLNPNVRAKRRIYTKEEWAEICANREGGR
jgi:hypothetical protein